MEVYFSRCRPVLPGDPDGFLFPARKGGAKTPAQLAAQIKSAITRETGIDLNAHAFRHLAALLFLRDHLGEYGTTRLILGHRSVSTTAKAYCGLEQATRCDVMTLLSIVIARSWRPSRDPALRLVTGQIVIESSGKRASSQWVCLKRRRGLGPQFPSQDRERQQPLVVLAYRAGAP